MIGKGAKAAFGKAHEVQNKALEFEELLWSVNHRTVYIFVRFWNEAWKISQCYYFRCSFYKAVQQCSLMNQSGLLTNLIMVLINFVFFFQNYCAQWRLWRIHINFIRYNEE